MKSTRVLAAAAAAAMAAAAAVAPALASGGGHASSTHTVVLKEVRYHPGTLTINRGDSVQWVWRDGNEKHNVTGHAFHSRTMSHGAYTVRFLGKGTFSYRCTIHESEGMRGKIIVR